MMVSDSSISYSMMIATTKSITNPENHWMTTSSHSPKFNPINRRITANGMMRIKRSIGLAYSQLLRRTPWSSSHGATGKSTGVSREWKHTLEVAKPILK
jgi:hypothetical protein